MTGKYALALAAALLLTQHVQMHQALAQMPACPVPPALALTGIALPSARDAVQTQKRLTILAVGGAATNGVPAHRVELTTQARLGVHLREALPGIEVTVITRAAVRRPAQVTAGRLDADLAETRANLVIWGVGATEAAHHADPALLRTAIMAGAAKARAAGADLLLADLQYTPALARAMNLTPYRDAAVSAAASVGAPLLDRFALMRAWHESGVLDLAATSARARSDVTHRLFDCVATALAEGIAAAVR
jgi:hypothetical protein